MQDWGINLSHRINFVGLFDTVSSFGNRSIFGVGFDNVARFQITALDEYRENFSVTHIRSARNGKFGIEIGINGAHSDVGGGYHAQESESYDTEVSQQALRNWLIKQGFFSKFEEKYIYVGRDSRQQLSHYHATRIVKNDIHKISLKMMRVALEHAILGIKFRSDIQPVETAQGEVYAQMGYFVHKVHELCNAGYHAHPNVIPLAVKNPNTLPKLRYTYVHWSAKYIKGSVRDTGLKVRLNGQGIPYRKSFYG